MNIQKLPPKMLQTFANRAANGDYDNYLGGGAYEWFQGNQVVCVIGPTNPVGHIEKISAAAMAERRKWAVKAAK